MSLSAKHFFSLHASRFIAQYPSDIDLHDKACVIHGKSWLDKSLARFNGFALKALLALDCLIYILTITSSAIKHLSIGMVCFARQYFGEGNPAGHCSRTILFKAKDYGSRRRSYEERTMVVGPLHIQSCVTHLQQKAKFADGHAYNVLLARQSPSVCTTITTHELFMENWLAALCTFLRDMNIMFCFLKTSLPEASRAMMQLQLGQSSP